MKKGKVSLTKCYLEIKEGLESVLRFSNYEMVDKFIESSFSVVVGVDSRLWWAEEQVGSEEETVSVYAASLIE